jgi:hypothetical protein
LTIELFDYLNKQQITLNAQYPMTSDRRIGYDLTEVWKRVFYILVTFSLSVTREISGEILFILILCYDLSIERFEWMR